MAHMCLSCHHYQVSWQSGHYYYGYGLNQSPCLALPTFGSHNQHQIQDLLNGNMGHNLKSDKTNIIMIVQYVLFMVEKGKSKIKEKE